MGLHALLDNAIKYLDPVAGESPGLTILSRITERHAGRIEVESTPGVGSEFAVTLPGVTAEMDLEVTV